MYFSVKIETFQRTLKLSSKLKILPVQGPDAFSNHQRTIWSVLLAFFAWNPNRAKFRPLRLVLNRRQYRRGGCRWRTAYRSWRPRHSFDALPFGLVHRVALFALLERPERLAKQAYHRQWPPVRRGEVKHPLVEQGIDFYTLNCQYRTRLSK